MANGLIDRPLLVLSTYHLTQLPNPERGFDSSFHIEELRMAIKTKRLAPSLARSFAELTGYAGSGLAIFGLVTNSCLKKPQAAFVRGSVT